MPTFGAESLTQLDTCDERLQRLMREVVRKRDCKIDKGHREQVEQDAAFVAGRSKVRWPAGNHNHLPSRALDAPPFPVQWGGTIAVQGVLQREAMDALLEDRYQAGFARGYLDLGGEPLRWDGRDEELVAPKVEGVVPRVHREHLHALVRFYDFGGYVLGTAARLAIPIRFGGDWDRDHDIFDDQTFQDLVHFELAKEAA